MEEPPAKINKRRCEMTAEEKHLDNKARKLRGRQKQKGGNEMEIADNQEQGGGDTEMQALLQEMQAEEAPVKALGTGTRKKRFEMTDEEKKADNAERKRRMRMKDNSQDNWSGWDAGFDGFGWDAGFDGYGWDAGYDWNAMQAMWLQMKGKGKGKGKASGKAPQMVKPKVKAKAKAQAKAKAIAGDSPQIVPGFAKPIAFQVAEKKKPQDDLGEGLIVTADGETRINKKRSEMNEVERALDNKMNKMRKAKKKALEAEGSSPA